MKSAVIQPAKLANACGEVRIDRYGPQRSMRTHRKFEMGSMLPESLDIFLCGAGEEKQFIKIALAD